MPMKFSQKVAADLRRGNDGALDPIDGTYGFVCTNETLGRECFRSTDWPTRKLAQARADQHRAEHDDHHPMPDKTEMLRGQGYEPDGAGGVRRVRKTKSEE